MLTSPPRIVGLGFDVSHHNVDARGRPIDWARSRAEGYRFVFVKASDGAAFRDPEFLNSARGARDAGLLVGAYHFLRPGPQAAEQAASFMRQIDLAGGPGVFELGAAVDVEDPDDDPGAWERLDKATRGDKVRHWIEGVREGFPTPMIYCIPSWWAVQLGPTPDLAAYPLWAASPGGVPKLVGTSWKSYALWQYAFHGTVDGVGFKSVDLDRPPPEP